MVPVGWHDVLEIVPSAANKTTLKVYGRKVECPPEKNLVMRAYNALCDYTGGLPNVDFYLEKIIPDGAGLGGGSADAAFALRGLNELFNLEMPQEILAEIASKIGADCAFFIYNRPALCEGIGDILTFDISPDLEGKSILIVKPHVASVSTREAYTGVTPHPSEFNLPQIVSSEVGKWIDNLHNDFENSIFPKIPELKALKQSLFDKGAEYASMTGSGSAIYGIFDSDKLALNVADSFSDCDKIVTKAIK